MTDCGVVQALEFAIQKYKDATHHVSCIIDISILKGALDIIERQNVKLYETDINLSAMRCAANSYKMEIERVKERVKAEVIKEFTKKVDELLERYSVIHENAEEAMRDAIECDNETIEMQSVWDVHTLIKNEMSEYEEMYRLQDNIENMAKERLLKEIEKDLRLLIKEMTEES